MTPRAARDTKTRILKATERLLETRKPVTIRAITSATGESVSAVHYHFGSREGLLRALPTAAMAQRSALHVIPGIVPDLIERPTGCSFRERCERAVSVCARVDPELEAAGHERAVACHNPVSDKGGRA